jgi:hypothetical protein
VLLHDAQAIKEIQLQTTTRTYYGLRDKHTGQAVRIEKAPTPYPHASEFRLSDDPEAPEFEVPSAEALALVLLDNPHSHSSTAESPNWGPFEAEQLQPQKVTVTVQHEDVELAPLAVAHTVHVRDIPYLVARRYAGGDFKPLPDMPRLTAWLVRLSDGQSIESVRADWVGKPVRSAGDHSARRHVYAVAPVPEEYGPDLAGSSGALLIASGLLY